MTRYVDTSALVKVLVEEAGSDATRRHLTSGEALTSALAEVELRRAVARHPTASAADIAAVLARITLIAIGAPVLDVAGRLPPVGLRPLDAIHLATAVLVRSGIEEFVTHDRQLSTAAREHGFEVVTPT